MTDNTCGSCALCCKLLGVEEIKKAVNTWCRHCSPGRGCGSYDERPSSCRTFECLWLSSQSLGQPMPLKLRPDQCKVVLIASDQTMQIQAIVDPTYPNAWRVDHLHQLLAKMADGGASVGISFGSGREKIVFVRQRPGMVVTHRVMASEADEHGMQTLGTNSAFFYKV